MPASTFVKSPYQLPGLSAVYGWQGWTTGGSISSSVVLAKDINNDGRDDLAVHFWQGQAQFGQVSTAEVPNRLVVYLAQADGSFVDATSQLFGTSQPVVLPGGNSRKVDVGDINRDGRPDWVYVLSREDGRSTSDMRSIESTSAVILSRPEGTYSVVPVGDPDWYHAARIYESDGVIHVAAQGFSSGKPLLGGADVTIEMAESYVLGPSGTSFQLAGSIPARASTFLVLPPQTVGGPATNVFSVGQKGPTFVLVLVEEGVDGQWRIGDAIDPYPTTQRVPFVWWNGAKEETNVSMVGGMPLVAPVFPESELMTPGPSFNPVVVVQAWANVIAAPRSDGYYYEGDGKPFRKLLFYEVQEGRLVDAGIRITGERTFENYNEFEFRDLNFDGLEDLVAYPFSKPARADVYLNLGNREFRLLDSAVLPAGPSWGSEEFPNGVAQFLDANGDGMLDLLYRVNNAQPQFGDFSDWEVHFGTTNRFADFDTASITIADRRGGTLLSTWGGNDIVRDTNTGIGTTHIDAGSGLDTATYSGGRSEFAVLASPSGGWTVARAGHVDDVLRNVERLSFTDASLALDLAGNAGVVVRTLGAVFGASAVTQRPDYVGIGLNLLDSGMSPSTLMDLALQARFGDASAETVVQTLYANVVGHAPSADEVASFVRLIEGGMSRVELASFAADTDLNKLKVDLVGLQLHGVLYT